MTAFQVKEILLLILFALKLFGELCLCSLVRLQCKKEDFAMGKLAKKIIKRIHSLVKKTVVWRLADCSEKELLAIKAECGDVLLKVDTAISLVRTSNGGKF